MTFGSLFAGIGGFDLGLERAGMTCAWQVEIDPYARRVLEKHWPAVRRWDDVRIFPPDDGTDWTVDLICGGFPCQDISCAGRRAGINGSQSGLWSEFARIIGVVRPRYVVVENVAALLVRGMGRVLGNLASLGYDAEWDVISAAAVGAPHIRERVWILAHTDNQTKSDVPVDAIQGNRLQDSQENSLANSNFLGLEGAEFFGKRISIGKGACNSNKSILSDSNRTRLEIRSCFGDNARQELSTFERSCREGNGQWAIEPDVGRVAYGVPHRVDRLRCLGNAVVPQIAEWIGRRIMEANS